MEPKSKSDHFFDREENLYWKLYFFPCRRYFDRKFYVMDSFITLFLFLFLSCFIVYIFFYQPSLSDPTIESIKNTFLTCQLIAIVLPLILIFLSNLLAKTSKAFFTSLVLITILSLTLTLFFIGLKTFFHTTYLTEKLENYYELQAKDNPSMKKNSIHIGFTGIQIKNPKEVFLAQNKTAYHFFQLKTFLFTLLQVLLVIFELYLIQKLYKIEEQKSKLSKNDKILYDTEENVKF